MRSGAWARAVDSGRRVSITTLGCKVNQAESDAIAAAIGGPCVVADVAQGADVIVINTCTVTGEADHKARKAIRHALGMPGAPMVVVTGCLAAVDPAGVAALGERVLVEPDKDRVAERVSALRRGRDALAGPRTAGGASTGEAADAGSGRSPAAEARHPRRARVQVKVQDGCDTFCSYCIVPKARGLPRSVPLETVVGTVRDLVAAGVAEVVLTGINIGRYDHGGARLPALLEAVAATGVRRVRLSSIEPGDVTPELLRVVRDMASFCRHLHIPLQSGADATLAAMARPYDTAAFAEVLARVREDLPGVAVTTDVIVGFPGERDADDEASRSFVRAAGFARLHVFRYSPRPGTPAAALPDQVAPPVRTARAAAMRALGEALSARYSQERLGTRAEVLAERVRTGRDGQMVAEGTTREYLRVAMPAEGIAPGEVLPVVIESVCADGAVVARVVR